MKNNIPYAAQLETALQAKDQEKVDKIMQDALDAIGDELTDFIQGYALVDLPIVAAVMTMLTNALTAALGEVARDKVDFIVKNTSCIAVDMDELKRQARGDDDGDKEKW